MKDPNARVDGPRGPRPGREPACDEVAAHAPFLVEGDLDEPVEERLRRHVSGCPGCATVVRRQATLSDWLRRLPAAPAVSLAPPQFPAEVPAGEPHSLDAARRRRRRVAATAAGLAAAAVAAVAVRFPSDTPRPLVPVRIVHVRDVAERAPLPDDDLLALTAGIENVALRRPTGWPSSEPAAPAEPR